MKSESGFSYIDVMIALVILMFGILGATGALTANLLRSMESEKQIIAKQMALSTIESIFSARDIARTGSLDGWHAVGNIGSNPINGTPMGVFLSGWRPVREDIGSDGVAGTLDDACNAPGPCQVSGVPDNDSIIIPGFERQITITDIADPERPSPPHAIARRRIDVSIRYNVNLLVREQTVSTIIANYQDQ